MSVPWSTKGVKPTPVNADELLIIDSDDVTALNKNKRITIGSLPSLGAPFPDTTSIVEGSVDDTKELRFEIGGFTAGALRVLTPPDADGIIVLENFAQTLTNKIMTATANTFSGFAIGTEVTGASTDLTDTADITYLNTPNSYIAGNRQNFLGDTSGTAGINVGGIAGNPTTQVNGDIWLNTSTDQIFGRINNIDIDLSSGGSQTPWTSDIVADGFDLTDLSNIEFRETEGAPAGTIQAIYADGGGIILNVPTSDTFLFKINDTTEYVFDANDLNMNQNGLFDVENIVFAETLLAPPTTAHAIYVDTAGIISHVPSGDNFDFQIALTSEYTFDNTDANWNDNNLINMGVLSFDDTATSLQQSTTDLLIDVAIGGTINLKVNGSVEYSFSAIQADFTGSTLVNATIVGTANSISAIQETMQTVNTGMSGTILTSNGVGNQPTYESLPGGGNVIGPGSSTDEAIVRFNGVNGTSIQDGIITIDDVANVEAIRSLQFVSHTSAPSPTVEYIAVVNNDFEINVTTGNNFKLEVDETDEYVFSSSAADFNNNDLIMGTSFIQFTTTTASVTGFDTVGKLFLDSGNSNHISIIRNGTAIDLEEGNQTPWESNIDADGFDLQDLSNIEFRETEGIPSAGVPSIYHQSTGITIVVPTDDSISFNVQTTTQYSFDATDADFNNNNLINVVVDSTVTGPSGITGLGTQGQSLDMGTNSISNVANITLNEGGTVLVDTSTANAGFRDIGHNADPSNNEAGDLYYNNMFLEYRFYNGTSWIGLNQTPWISDIDADGFDLSNIPQIRDSNGNELLIFTTTTDAVNEITLVNAATGTPVQLQATGGDSSIDVQFVAKGTTGTFFGNRETWAWPLTDETTAPTVGVKYTTEPAPYNMTIEGAVAGLTTAGTGAALFTIDVLKEDAPNANTFTTIFSTLVTIDASEFTSTSAATSPVISVSTWQQGRRLQLKIDTLDSDTLARGAKILLLTHATDK